MSSDQDRTRGAHSFDAGAPAVETPRTPERTIGQLVADASADLSAIIRGEIQLAKAEVTKGLSFGGKGAGLLGGGAAGSIEELEFPVGEDRAWGGVRIAAPEHGHPVDAPGDNAAERDAVGEAIGGGEPDLLDTAAGFEGLEEGLDGGVIVAIALAAHRHLEPMLAQNLLIVVRTVLASAIAVEDAAPRR